MNEQNYDNQLLTDYLLGALSESDSEPLDELSVISDDFSSAIQAAEHDLIDAYLNEELNRATLEKFKNYYLASPLRREKVELARSLRTYLAKERAPGRLQAEHFTKTNAPKKKAFFSSLNIFTNTVYGWTAPVLGLFIIALLLGGFWIVNRLSQPDTEVSIHNSNLSNENIPDLNSNRSAAPQRPTGENIFSESGKEKQSATPKVDAVKSPKPEKTISPPRLATAAFILTPPLRGGNQIPTISYPRDTVLILMSLQTESNEYKTYRVSLVNQSNEKFWQRNNLRVKNGLINFSFPANLLKSGIYSVILSGITDEGDSEAISNYPFKVLPK